MDKYLLELQDLVETLNTADSCLGMIDKIKSTVKCKLSVWDRHRLTFKSKSVTLVGMESTKVLVEAQDFERHAAAVKDWNNSIDEVYKMLNDLTQSIKQLEMNLKPYKEIAT